MPPSAELHLPGTGGARAIAAHLEVPDMSRVGDMHCGVAQKLQEYVRLKRPLIRSAVIYPLLSGLVAAMAIAADPNEICHCRCAPWRGLPSAAGSCLGEEMGSCAADLHPPGTGDASGNCCRSGSTWPSHTQQLTPVAVPISFGSMPELKSNLECDRCAVPSPVWTGGARVIVE